MKRLLLLSLAIALAACTTGTQPDPTTTVTIPDDTAPAPPSSTEEILESLGGELCPDSDFTCVMLEMPLDHFDPAEERTIDVTFAVLPASGESRGAFVTATGGPGSSGIAVADSYAGLYDVSIAEQFDIVFFDQRGIASSGGFTCPMAAAEYFRAPGNAVSAAGINLFVEAAEEFADDCVDEMGDPEELAYVSTAQAVEDLEVFRQTFGFDEFVVFGESYGTQLGQTYAAAHGEHLDRLIIDGVVDLTLEGITYHQEMAASSSRTLDLVLEACDEDTLCPADFGMPAGDAYDLLSSQLIEDDLTAEFPLPDGSTAERSLSLGDLEVVASGQLYEEYDRMMFLRALSAWSGDGDLVPLLRLLYIDLALDPQTEEAIEDPTWSDAMYFGVECLDYAYPGATPEETATAIIDGAPDPAGLRLASVYYGDLPCAFWPHTTDEGRPPPLTAEGIDVLVLGSTVDPVTPHHQGVAVHSRLASGHIMSKEGGPHVIYGWGEDCPDREVTAFILDGTAPTSEICYGVVVGEYQPRFSAGPEDDAETLMSEVEWEVFYLPEYYYWDWYSDTSVGCSHGGTLSWTSTDVGADLVFEDCGLSGDVVLTGTGSHDFDNDIFTLDVSMGECSYSYERSGGGHRVESACD